MVGLKKDLLGTKMERLQVQEEGGAGAGAWRQDGGCRYGGEGGEGGWVPSYEEGAGTLGG